MRKQMCTIAKSMWDRRLTNAAGGNFAVLVDDNRILISPSLMSERKQCDLKPEDFILMDFEQNIIEGTGNLSRESDMHIALLRDHKNICASIHAHPFYCMPFVSQAKDIPSVTEATLGRGDVGCIEFTKAYTPELAANVARYFEEKRELADKKPIAVILPLHGVVVTGPDLHLAYSMLERIECDAFCNIVKKLI